MVLGGLGAVVGAVERLAAGWGVGVLIDESAHAALPTPHAHHGAQGWVCRVRDAVRYGKRGSEQPLLLWEELKQGGSLKERDRRDAGEGDGDGGQWMYADASRMTNVWEGYNATELRAVAAEGRETAAARLQREQQSGVSTRIAKKRLEHPPTSPSLRRQAAARSPEPSPA
eukprot:gene7341-61240_t